MAVTVASLEARFGADTTEFDRKAGQVHDRMTGLGSGMQDLGKKMGSVGQKLTLAMAPAALALGFSTRQAIEFESAFAGVEKTVDGTEAELSELRSTIREMATSADNPLAGLENAHVTLAQIMELGGQLGVPLANLDDFAQTIGELTIATDLTAESASLMLAQFANITGMSFSDFDRLGAVIVDLGNNSATTESQIVEMMNRLAGAGASFGLTEANIAALGAAMASTGLAAEAAGTAMTTIFTEMSGAVIDGGDKLDQFAEIAGWSADEFAQSWENEPIAALDDFIRGLGEMDAAQRELALEDLGLDGIRVADVLRRLSNESDTLSDAIGRSNVAWNENTALSQEAATRFETTEAQMNLLKNRINDLAITIGEILLPAFNSILDTLSPLIEKVNEYAAAHPEVIQFAATLTVGLLALGATMTILGPIVTGLGTLLAFGSTALAVALGILLSPFGAVLAGVALGVFVFTQLKDKIGPLAEKLKDALAPAFETVGSVIGTVVGGIGDLIGVIDSVVGSIESAAAAVGLVNDEVGEFRGTPSDSFRDSVARRGGGDSGGSDNGGQHGIAWTGHGPLTQEAGVFHRGESVIPAGGMTATIVPTPQGPVVHGAGGGRTVQINISQLDVHGVENPEDLYDKLQRVARQRA